jgi:AraC-like DNA-binding protein
MRSEPHHCRVLASPWAGVFATEIESARHFGRHSHATYGFGLLDAGAQRSASGRGIVEAYPGDVITTNPGEIHDGRPLGGPSRRWRMVYLEPDVLASITAGDGRHPGDVALTQPVLADPALARAISLLLHRLGSWNARAVAATTEALACEEAMALVCERLLSRHASCSPVGVSAPPHLEAVRQRLAAEESGAPTLAELATLAGTSRFQILRAFNRTYGLPPHAWLLQQRVERARVRIRNGDTLAGAAHACGFADQSHLTRVFTRHFGFTPGAWRRAVRPLQ